MHSFCLLTSMELIRIPNSSLLYFHSKNINSLKNLFLKKNYSYKYNCYKNTQLESVCNRLNLLPSDCWESLKKSIQLQLISIPSQKYTKVPCNSLSLSLYIYIYCGIAFVDKHCGQVFV